jgi:hypothetical protein
VFSNWTICSVISDQTYFSDRLFISGTSSHDGSNLFLYILNMSGRELSPGLWTGIDLTQIHDS